MLIYHCELEARNIIFDIYGNIKTDARALVYMETRPYERRGFEVRAVFIYYVACWTHDILYTNTLSFLHDALLTQNMMMYDLF